MYIRFLGTADAYPSGGRYHASIAIVIRGSTYLIDCGEPCAATLIRSGINPNTVKAAFISHVHSDHISGLPTLVDTAKHERKGEPLRVYLPASALHGIASYLNLVGTPHDDLYPIKHGQLFEDGGVSVQAYPTRHIAESYAFVLEHDGKRIVYSGDLGSADDIADLYDGSEIVITELAHFQPDELVEALAGRSIGKVYITHVNFNFLPERMTILKRIRDRLPGMPIFMAEDGLVVPV